MTIPGLDFAALEARFGQKCELVPVPEAGLACGAPAVRYAAVRCGRCREQDAIWLCRACLVTWWLPAGGQLVCSVCLAKGG